MAEITIPILVFLSVLAIGVSLLLARKQRQVMAGIKLQDSRFVELPGKEKSKQFSFLRLLARIGNMVSHGNASKTLNEQLVRAGYIGSAAPAVYTGIKVLLFLLGLVVMTVLLMPTKFSGTQKTVLIALAASILFFIPNFIVVAQLARRRDEIRQHLPQAVDLLEICVSSGLGLDMAWHIVSEEIRQVSPILANAMSLTNFEMNLGAGRVDAMRHMAERTGANELSSLATILIQTERFGTSIAETLKIFANSMREARTHTAEEGAEKMTVKLIFPMVLFIFPAVLVTVAGPALITMLKLNIFGSG
jgi:tight adherence protein C